MGSVKEDTHNTVIAFCEDGGRPIINVYDNLSIFRPNDDVHIINPARNGRFKVEKVHNGKCTLLDENGRSVDGGKWFDELALELEEEEAFK